MTADLCACGLPCTDVPPGHTRVRGTDGTEQCGPIDVTNPPAWLEWSSLESLSTPKPRRSKR